MCAFAICCERGVQLQYLCGAMAWWTIGAPRAFSSWARPGAPCSTEGEHSVPPMSTS